ncbi:MAG: hypothetical protein GYA66_07860, partial [Phyllobacteriaceae bacterium]|nr:hypothetical protein [Phyllobacteriaceae bacterium]
MALHESYDTDDSAIPAALRRFMRNRAYELSGFILLSGIALAGLSLASWSAKDPSFNHATDALPVNWLGYPGATLADLLVQHLGLASLAFIFIPLAWVYRLFSHRDIVNFKMALLYWLLSCVGVCLLASSLPAPAAWPLTGGLGGQVGDSLSGIIIGTLSIGLKPILGQLGAVAMGGTAFIWCALRATGLTGQDTRDGVSASGRMLGQGASSLLGAAMSGAGRLAAVAGKISGLLQHRASTPARGRSAPVEDDDDILTRLAPARGSLKGRRKLEPTLIEDSHDDFDAEEQEDVASGNFEDGILEDEEECHPVSATPPAAIAKSVAKLKGKRKPAADVFELPDLDLLSEPKRPAKQHEVSADVLEGNARNLEGVLDDFGVKGQIIDVKPGPVVTLYELEPAPGIKSSRVISLADDIARSMSAISARVAVV